MELGIFGSSRNVEDLKEQVKVANDLGYATFWTPQIFNLDALTALAVVAESAPVDGDVLTRHSPDGRLRW